MGLFFKKSKPKAGTPESRLTPALMGPLTVSVLADPEGLAFIKTQLELDIKGKSLGYRPIPYTLFELIELESMVYRKPEGGRVRVVYSHSERQRLASYVVHYMVLARDIEDFEKATAYKRLLMSLIELATLVDTAL